MAGRVNDTKLARDLSQLTITLKRVYCFRPIRGQVNLFAGFVEFKIECLEILADREVKNKCVSVFRLFLLGGYRSEILRQFTGEFVV